MNRTKKLNVGIVFGGVSSEYEISLLSATSVLKNIDKDIFNIFAIGITKTGDFSLYTGDYNNIENNKWKDDKSSCTPCVISPDHSHHGLITLGEKTEIINLDCVFPVLHGKNGEDGTIQGLLQLSSIPFVGCDVLSSACCMDKAVTKALLDNAHIKNSRWFFVLQSEYEQKKEFIFSKIEKELKFPCFVKPANAGSSVGITKATDSQSLEEAFILAFSHDKKVVVEETIVGLELECAVLGNDQPIASIIGEIEQSNEFYDYESKYIKPSTTYAPARIEEMWSNKIREIAIDAYKTLGCSGLCRIDFFLTNDKAIVLNELNTIPGFTSISMYPQLFIKSGIDYKTLITKLIDYAIEKKQK